MEHKFNVQFAIDYGIEEAVMIENLYFWIAKNVANGRHKYNGRYWTYNTAKAFADLFPYLNETKIYRILSHLEQVGFIHKDKFNKEKYIQTKWYAFTDDALKILLINGYNVTNFSDFLQNDKMHFTNLQNGTTNNANCINNNYTDSITNSKEKEIDKSISKKSDDLFEQCWIAYKRKGVKKQSKAQWERLSNEDKEKVLPHIRAYVSTREIQYQKDFERYLRDKLFNEVVYNKNQVIYDPARCQEYMPNGFAIYPNEQDKCFYFVGNYSDGDQIFDGYDDSERPDGAQIVLNNGRGTLTWNKEQNKWIWKRR